MSAPCVSPCGPWVSAAELTSRCPSVSGANATSAALAATEFLFELSGERFVGSCADTVRPCYTPCSCGWSGDGGWWYSPSKGTQGWGCSCSSGCGCGPIPQVDLGMYPLTAITTVKVDGATIPNTSYRIDDYRYLVRTDGMGWPGCQRMELADTQVGTFSVALTYGQAPPELGRRAALIVGCEYGKDGVGADCALPPNVLSMVRQGITQQLKVAITDPSGKYRTGNRTVDEFLEAYNPGDLRRSGEFVDLHELAKARRITG